MKTYTIYAKVGHSTVLVAERVELDQLSNTIARFISTPGHNNAYFTVIPVSILPEFKLPATSTDEEYPAAVTCPACNGRGGGCQQCCNGSIIP